MPTITHNRLPRVDIEFSLRDAMKKMKAHRLDWITTPSQYASPSLLNFSLAAPASVV